MKTKISIPRIKMQRLLIFVLIEIISMNYQPRLSLFPSCFRRLESEIIGVICSTLFAFSDCKIKSPNSIPSTVGKMVVIPLLLNSNLIRQRTKNESSCFFAEFSHTKNIERIDLLPVSHDLGLGFQKRGIKRN